MKDQNMIDYAEDPKKYTVKELRQTCRKTGKKGYSNDRKVELMDLLNEDEEALQLLSQGRREKTKVKINIKKKTKKDLE